MGHTLVESAATEPFLLRDNIPPERFAGQCLEVLEAEVTEHRALFQATEVERDRLLELVTVLQKRVEESSDRVLEAEQKLQEERWRSDILEQQLEKLQVDPESSTTAQKAPLRHTTGQSGLSLHVSDREELSAALSTLPLESQVEEMTVRLEIQWDQNKVLKAALEDAVRRREEDFQLYQDTIEEVKNRFSLAIQRQKQEKS